MRRKYSTQRGLSLMETAVGIAVLGLIALPMIRTKHIDLAREVHQSQRGVLHSAIGGVNQYFASGNSSYPCPADLSLKEGDESFGIASDCSSLSDIDVCGPPSSSWFTNGGICKTDDTASAVIIGGVPFADLKMSQEDAIDYWGNKIIYAVTYHQTNPNTYSVNSGTIRVMSVDDPKDVADGFADGIPGIVGSHYEIFVFSTGENGEGGYSRNGKPLSNCGSDNDQYEYENCDFDNVFFALTDPNNNDASAYSLKYGKTYFDDLTDEQQYMPVNTWFQHEDNALYANGDFILTGATRIGIGTQNPNYALHVEGNIEAEAINATNGGHISANEICDDDASNCFNPQIITGNIDTMSCEADVNPDYSKTRGVVSIRYSSVRCGGSRGNSYHPALHVDMSKFKATDCTSGGKIAVGFKANGELKCATP